MNPIQAPKGMNDLAVFLNFLGDKKAYAARAEDIQSKIDEANGLIAKIGAVKDIERIREEAEAKKTAAGEAARKTRADADAYAEQTTAAAKVEASGVRRALKEAASKLDARRVAVEAREAEVSRLPAALGKRESDIVAKEKDLATAQAAAEVARADYESRIGKLEEAKTLMEAAAA